MTTPTDPRNLRAPTTELQEAVRELRPYFVRSAWFAVIASLLVLMPTWYMLEVYDRVVNSRNHMTLVSYVVMELLEWAHGEEMHRAGLALDRKLAPRLFGTIFEANLKRMPGGTTQPLSDLRALRDFLPSQLLKSLVEIPVAIV